MTQSRKTALIAVAIVMVATATLAAAAAAVTGMAPKATRGFPSVVMLHGGPPVAAPAEAAVLNQVDKAFAPGVLLARAGQTVTFRNGEDMLHNVHVYDLESDETVINAAQPIYGTQTDHVFEKPGAYVVLCDVHPEMEAYVVVSDTPYATVAAADGTFALDVPPGDYELEIWNVDDKKQRAEKTHVGTDGLEIR